MGQRLTWDTIKTRYDQQWVLLTDHEWPEGEPYPSAGVVAIHASTKKDFDRALRGSRNTLPGETAMVYVGKPPRDPNTIYFNLYTLKTCE